MTGDEKKKHKKDETPASSHNEGSTGAAKPAEDGASGEQVIMMAVPMNEYDAMQKELEQARNAVGENFEGWQRERADFANYKRLIERDQAQLTQKLQTDLLKKFLIIYDDMDRALKHCPPQGEGKEWLDGITLIQRKLQSILDSIGVEIVPAEGEFNPAMHEAISNEESKKHKSGEIIEVLEQGYKIGDRVIRPARVRVAR